MNAFEWRKLFYYPVNSLQAGGQDDLVTIFSVMEGRVIARCQGHSSFVSSVAFDPVRTDKRSYRFGSVGEDDKLILVSIIFSSSQSWGRYS